MTKADDAALTKRSDAIFKAGADADSPKPTFEGNQLGSMESCTFYDGYASTHPSFLNPYRQRYGRSS